MLMCGYIPVDFTKSRREFRAGDGSSLQRVWMTSRDRGASVHLHKSGESTKFSGDTREQDQNQNPDGPQNQNSKCKTQIQNRVTERSMGSQGQKENLPGVK